MGKPDEAEWGRFDQIPWRDITIWKAADVEPDREKRVITIDVTKFLFFQSLTVRGARAVEGAERKKQGQNADPAFPG